MHSGFNVFDAHCDSVVTGDLLSSGGHLKVSDMKKYHRYLQVFAVCAEHNYAYTHACFYIKKYRNLMKLLKIAPVLKKEDLNVNYGGILALEGCDALHGKLFALRRFYDKGLRVLTLTWNNDNDAASAVFSGYDRGLTLFGKKLVSECESLGIVVDLSHISDRSFSDVADIAQKPFICSHSNSRSVNGEWKRNITDEQFETLINVGGVTGINYCTDFLGKKGDTYAVLRHIEHFCSLGGSKNVGLGSDFDGIPNLPKECDGAGFALVIANELLRRNYPESTVRAILYENFYRVFEKCLN